MKNYLKKMLAYIATGSFTLILAACYGAPVEMEYQKTIRAIDENENPIPGLEVKLLNDVQIIETVQTDEYGYVDFNNVNSNNASFKVEIKDVDAEENLGVFKDTVFDLNSQNYYEIKMKK